MHKPQELYVVPISKVIFILANLKEGLKNREASRFKIG